MKKVRILVFTIINYWRLIRYFDTLQRQVCYSDRKMMLYFQAYISLVARLSISVLTQKRNKEVKI